MSGPPDDSAFLLGASSFNAPMTAVVQSHYDAPADTDRPVRLRSFRRNVRRAKIALGISLAASIVTGVAHITHLSFPRTLTLGRGADKWLPAARWGADALILVLTIGSTVLYLLTLLHRPFPARLRPADLGGLANMRIHRLACVGIFLAALVSIVAHMAPTVVYTLVTKRGAPPVNAYLLAAGRLHMAALVATFFSVGCMRRGPLLRARQPNLGTSFGIRSSPSTESFDWHRFSLDMDDDPRLSKVIDYGDSSMLTFLTLGYSINLAKRSLEVDQLTQHDLPLLEEWVRKSGSEYLTRLDPRGGHFQRATSMGLVRALWAGRGWTVFITFVLETVNVFFSFMMIGALHELIDSFDNPDHSYSYLMCWGMLVGQAVGVILSAYLWVRENYLLHNPVRMTLSCILYAKILRSTDVKAMEAQHLTSAQDEKDNKGRSQVMNLLTIDTSTVASMATYLWNITNGITRLFLGLIFMYKMLGYSSAIALLCIPLFAPISVWIAKRIYECDKGWARARDARTGAIKEFLAGIKVIKLNGFEDYEIRRVGALRDIETSWQRWRYTLGTLFNIVADALPNVAIAATFVFYTKVLGNELDPATAFVTVVVFINVKVGLDAIPNAIDVVLNSKVALDRLRNYLNQPEVAVDKEDVSDGMVAMDNATYTWPAAEEMSPAVDAATVFRMRRVTLSLPPGKMTLVCGPLGSGKTLFLRALLGEAKLDSGHIIAPRSATDATPLETSKQRVQWTNELWLKNSVAYAPQMSYIRHGSIRDNILFGLPMWEERYKEVLRQCSLEPDLELLVDGDKTEVGEHGVNLSGGQKARINLARCVYSRAKTMYLDDVLSAVDAHTAQYIVDECLRGSLLKHRTVVLVSHHVDLVLPAASYVVALGDGRVQEACSARRAHVASLLALTSPTQAADELPMSPVSPIHSLLPSEALGTLDTLVHLDRDAHEAPFDEGELVDEMELDEILSEEADQRDPSRPRELYTVEHQAKGHVSRGHYWLMFAATGGIGYWIIFTLLYGGTKVISFSLDWVMKIWTEDPDPKPHLDYYIKLFLWGKVAWILVGACRWVWLYGVGNVGFYSGATKKIHRRLFRTIAQAPISFFEVTPPGRILNIFSQDVRRLDTQSADEFGRTVSESLRVLVSAGTVSWASPVMLLVLGAFGAPLAMVANRLGKLRTNLRRLAAVADSPLISLYHDSIDGVVMLRAFGLPHAMTEGLQVIINRSRTAETWNWICYNWVRAVVMSISSVFVALTGFVLIGRDISPAFAGFILNFAAQVSVTLFSLVDHFINLEQTFVSAERVNYYIQNTAQEPESGIEPPPGWPTQGRIDIRDLSVRYAPDLPDVLHSINLSIEPGQRVGLVGATGSGKSTLALSLFRAVEPTGGSIEIDGIDTAKVQLQALRQRLNMVVQDGSLPSGTLRNALDISGEADDHEVYDALRRVHLLPDVVTENDVKTNPFANLDTFVAAEGSNFSHGQRQLLCLARALLKKSRVLVMDEATSSVDFEMDAKITQTIRDCFAHTTMIVIAHRLATIVAFDRVVVLSRGRVLEYDNPLVLMQRQDSAFHALCMAQGKDEFDRLFKAAGGKQ